MNAANETLLGGENIDRARPGLLDEFQKVNGCEIGKRKATSDYKLPAIYVFHTVGPRDKNENKLKDCYESCSQKVGVYSVTSIAFCCIGTCIPGFDPRTAAQMAQGTARLWLESNHFSDDRVIFCTYEII